MKCHTCGKFTITPVKDDQGNAYCSEVCFTASVHQDFCASCKNETVSDSTGDLYLHNGFGSSLKLYRDRCPVCGSVRADLCYSAPFFIYRRGTFRVKFSDNAHFIARRTHSSRSSILWRGVIISIAFAAGIFALAWFTH